MNQREIKFRIWNSKSMIYPHTIESNFLVVRLDGEINGTCFGELDGPESGSVLLQYTGLKDKNNKEIYDGDIVKVSRCHTVSIPTSTSSYTVELVEDGEQVGHVFWADYFFQYRVSFDHIRYDDFEALMDNEDRYEVVGNIYENPELIKL